MKTSESPQRESTLRSLIKAVSWRIIATLTTICIAWLVFDDIDKALAVGGIEFFVKFVIYFLHERAWQLVPRGTFRSAKSTS